VLERFPATIQLTLAGMAIALLIAIPLGVVAAIRRYSFLDNLCTALAVSGQAMPIFWLGLMLIILFAVKFHLLPASGRGTFLHLLMPAFTLGASLAPITMRMTRSKMLDILSADYIRTARAKGLREQIVLFRHALRNASIPIVTILGLQFGRLLGGAIVTEAVFAWPAWAAWRSRRSVTSTIPWRRRAFSPWRSSLSSSTSGLTSSSAGSTRGSDSTEAE